MPHTTTNPRDAAALAASEWLAPLQLARARDVFDSAIGVACHFAGEPRPGDQYSAGRDLAYVDLQPGNGTAYRMLIALLPEGIRPSLGYGLVLTFPDFGACLALDPFGFHVPGYIDEKLDGSRLGGAGGSAIIAAFTTILSAHLDHLLNP